MVAMLVPEIEGRLADLAFDRREAARVLSDLAVPDRGKAERQRVEGLLCRDKAERQADQFREEARTRFENGDSASSADAVVPPTPEWLAKGDVESFIPHQDKHSTRLVKTVRRERVRAARKLHLSGVIDFPGLLACEWYEELYENTGLSGNLPSTDYDKEVFSPGGNRFYFTDWQIDAQAMFREVRRGINAKFLPLLDAIVLDGIPIYKAQRLIRVRHATAKAYFGLAVEQLCCARKAVEA